MTRMAALIELAYLLAWGVVVGGIIVACLLA